MRNFILLTLSVLLVLLLVECTKSKIVNDNEYVVGDIVYIEPDSSLARIDDVINYLDYTMYNVIYLDTSHITYVKDIMIIDKKRYE